ncbi:uncharacterized protein HKW66_Vig0096290 [Vigna angularis]|uniref:Uncharacterized protein n=1 Tax=Phaseolus angularis TaxID=3914 RepID=A0A8T0KKL6_PHAAN|nr:uncharacterized protein HKW66_Vig0096290 [Vigna angularis]
MMLQYKLQTAKIKALYVIAPCRSLWVGIGLTIFFHKEHQFYGLLLRHKFQITIRCSVSTRTFVLRVLCD